MLAQQREPLQIPLAIGIGLVTLLAATFAEGADPGVLLAGRLDLARRRIDGEGGREVLRSRHRSGSPERTGATGCARMTREPPPEFQSGTPASGDGGHGPPNPDA